ncbi:hypothetical protein [Streptomyces sp. 061-3]|uniref:hypothetical protein n=1 Tax=Streptomyces sp. 061-3 TaxID=2789268 RepID=UPI00397F0E85
MSTPIAIGQPVNRVDGRHKVTGSAHYSADFLLDNMAYAVVVGARVPSGRDHEHQQFRGAGSQGRTRDPHS